MLCILEETMKKLLLTGMMLCLTVSMATAAPGLNFNWSAAATCPVSATAAATWDCAGPSANNGTFYMIVSVVSGAAIQGFNAMDARIDGQSLGNLPAWWQIECRSTSFAPAGPTNTTGTICASAALWNGTPAGGIGAWVYDAPDRFHTVIGLGSGLNRVANLSLTSQYNVFNIKMDTQKSVDVPADPDNEVEAIPACLGCDVPVTLVLNQVGLYGNTGGESQVTDPGVTQRCITWQGGAGPSSCGATPARNTTWGQVKSLYR
jgi:hypothetical protein